MTMYSLGACAPEPWPRPPINERQAKPFSELMQKGALLEIEPLLESMHLLVIQRLGFQDIEELPPFRRTGSVATTGEKLRCGLVNEGTGVVSTNSGAGTIAIA